MSDWKPPFPLVRLPDCQQNWDDLTKHLHVLSVYTTTVDDTVFSSTPADGTIVLEDVASVRKICARIGGAWYKATLS